MKPFDLIIFVSLKMIRNVHNFSFVVKMQIKIGCQLKNNILLPRDFFTDLTHYPLPFFFLHYKIEYLTLDKGNHLSNISLSLIDND